MSLLRLTAGWVALTLLGALAAPAAADQVFSTTSTGPVYPHASQAPYPLGDLYYAPCGWYGNYGGGLGSNHGGRYGRGGHRGNTTITGERFYPYDIGSNGNRIGSHGHNSGYNCYGNSSASPRPHQPVPVPYATPRS